MMGVGTGSFLPTFTHHALIQSGTASIPILWPDTGAGFLPSNYYVTHTAGDLVVACLSALHY